YNQNLGYDNFYGYTNMGWAGYSSAIPNVGMYANLDPRTQQLAIDTLHQFFAAGGTLPIVFESVGNPNSWAVAAPTYYDWNTPKFQAAAVVEQATQPATYGLTLGQSFTYWGGWLLPGQGLSSTWLVPRGSYVLTMTASPNWGAPAGQT